MKTPSDLYKLEITELREFSVLNLLGRQDIQIPDVQCGAYDIH